VVDGTPHPWEFARVWHLEPSLSDPDAVLAGVEDAALFNRPTVVRIGANYRACANKTLVHRGSPVREDVLALDHREPEGPGAHLRGHFVGGAFRTDDGARVGDRSIKVFTRRGFPTGTPKSGTAFTTSRSPFEARHVVHAEALGRDANGQCRRFVVEISGNLRRLWIRD